MIRAKDIMTTDVVTVNPGMTVEEFGNLLMEKGISGAPVLDADQRLFGIVTENDLIKQNKRLHIPTVMRLFDAIIPLEGDKYVEEQIRIMSASTVGDICTRKVISIEPETPLHDIATIMHEKGVHLLPVMSSGKLVGIIGKNDIIRATLRGSDEQRSG